MMGGNQITTKPTTWFENIQDWSLIIKRRKNPVFYGIFLMVIIGYGNRLSEIYAMNTKLFEENLVLKSSFEFSLLVIDYCEALQQQKKFVISNQLLKSGTSIGANIMEAQNSESRVDFIHKIKIAAKEADESQYWILLCQMAEKYPACDLLEVKLTQIQKILSRILSTSKKRFR
ncbi:MAG TPA: four helix bundle protein [Flavisolibacter sp.]